MINNLELWESVCKTDPKYTKKFKRPGGFEGTAQNPTYAIKKMTEIFGSCGSGWGIGKPDFHVQEHGELGTAVYCTIELWYKADGEKCSTYGVGGDTIVTKGKNGLTLDDEAFKKAQTDAMTNAMKTLGVAADLYLGMYDDSKYINSIKEEFKTEEKKTNGMQEAQEDALKEWPAKFGDYKDFYTRSLNALNNSIDIPALEKSWKFVDGWRTTMKANNIITKEQATELLEKYQQCKDDLERAQ
jgi:hypothetical protein